MPEDRIPVRVTHAARERIAYSARLDGISNLKRLERLIQDAAMALPPVPPTPTFAERERARYLEHQAEGLDTTAIAVIRGVPADRVRRVRDREERP